jgi:diacylglycerol O-acyltransferase
MKQLSLLDSTFLLDSPRTPNHLCMANIYDPSTAPAGEPSFAAVVAKIEQLLPRTPSLRQKLVRVPFDLDRPYWAEDPELDVEFHLRELALPRPGDWRQWCIQMARLNARPIDISRPPWEMTVVRGLDGIDFLPKGCFATILKVHHSVIDGVSGVEMTNEMHDLRPDPPPAHVDRLGRPEPLPSTTALLQRAAVHAVVNPVNAMRYAAANASPLGRDLVGRIRSRAPRLRVPRTRFNQRVSAHRVFDEIHRRFDDVRRIKATVPGATVNDVCLSIVGGAMRTYLDKIGELPDEPMVTMVPVSTRTPEQAGSGGNQVGMMRVSMHTHLADPVPRLAAIHAETTEKKAAQDGLSMNVLLDIAQAVPGALIGVAARAMTAFGGQAPVMANTIVTNVPGPKDALYFLGARMVHGTGCVPLMDGTGLFHCVGSYDGRFSLSFTACRDMLPDPTPYWEALSGSFDEHLQAAET